MAKSVLQTNYITLSIFLSPPFSLFWQQAMTVTEKNMDVNEHAM